MRHSLSSLRHLALWSSFVALGLLAAAFYLPAIGRRLHHESRTQNKAPVSPRTQKPELVIQAGHNQAINLVSFSPDGKLLATGGEDDVVRLWDWSSGLELRAIPEVSGDSFAFSPDSNRLAVAGIHGTLTVLDVKTGTVLTTMKGSGSTEAVAFSPDGSLVASAHNDIISFWDASTGIEVRRLNEEVSLVRCLVFSPDGKHLGSAQDQYGLRLWDVSSGAHIRDFPSIDEPIWSIVFSPDGELLAASGAFGNVDLWDPSTGKQVASLQGNHSFARSVAFSRDGKLLAAASDDHKVHVWNVKSQTEVMVLSGHSDEVTSVRFDPSADILASGSRDRSIKLWDINTGLSLRTMRGWPSIIHSVAFSPTTKLIASANDDGVVTLWDSSGGSEVRQIKSVRDFVASLADRDAPSIVFDRWHAESINTLAFSPDGTLLAGAGNDYSVRLWDVNSGSEVRRLRGHKSSVTSIAFSRDGKFLASTDSRDVRVSAIKTGSLVRTFKQSSCNQTNVAFGPDSSTIAFGGAQIKLWNINTGLAVQNFVDRFPFKTPDDPTITVHAAPSTCPAADPVTSIAFSGDGRLLASGDDHGLVKLWDPQKGKELRVMKSRTGSTESLSFSPDGKLLASGSTDSTVKIWSTTTGAEIDSLKGHIGTVNSVAFSQDGALLASGSDDASVKIWALDGQRELLSLVSVDTNDWVAVAPDGLFDGSNRGWQRVLWRFDRDTFRHAPVEAFFNQFFHPGIVSEVFNGQHPAAPTSLVTTDIRVPTIGLKRIGSPYLDNNQDATATDVEVDVFDAPADQDHPKTGSGAKDVRLFRNGSLVRRWSGDVLDGRSSIALKAHVPLLVGHNTFTAYAFNRQDIRTEDTKPLKVEGPATDSPGVLYIVSVGINSYTDSVIRDLKFAVDDAVDFGNEVAKQQRAYGNYGQIKQVVLTDQLATKRNILLALQRLSGDTSRPLPLNAPKELEQVDGAKARDALIIFFASHGISDGDRFYLLPHDVTPTTPNGTESRLQEIIENGLSDEDLAKALEPILAERILLVIDACDSGQALGASGEGPRPLNNKGLAQLAYDRGMYVLTASQSQESAREISELGHGLLTYALVEEGLKQGKAARNDQGQITERSWLNYAATRVPAMRKQKQRFLENESREVRARGDRSFRVGDDIHGEHLVNDGGQRPRIFYRTELEDRPWIISQPAAGDDPSMVVWAQNAKAVSDQFLTNLHEKNFRASYSALSAKGKTSTSHALLQSSWEALEQQGGRITHFELKSCSRSYPGTGEPVSVSLRLTYEIDSPKGYVAVVFEMSEEKNEWKIDDFQFRDDLRF